LSRRKPGAVRVKRKSGNKQHCANDDAYQGEPEHAFSVARDALSSNPGGVT
jgi:hypothetical protein